MLTYLPVLERADCERVSSIVAALRSEWIPRTPPPAAFFTLGLASYQDLAGPQPGLPEQNYYEAAPRYNALLLDRLGWLLEEVRSSLERYLGANTWFSPCLAVPGFHIFEDAAIPRTDVASIHFDLQYELINWDDGGTPPDREGPISFTLPVRLPAGGGGLNTWDITYADVLKEVHAQPGMSVAEIAMQSPKTFNAYSLGALALHSGHQLHQIAAVADVQPGDQRITLQGHGLRQGTGWILYW